MNQRLPRALPPDQMVGVTLGAMERRSAARKRDARKREREETKVCEWEKCNKRFRPYRPEQRFCSKAHQEAARGARRRAAVRELPDPRLDYREGDRYVVLETIGWPITTAAREGKPNPTASYTVVDDAYGRTVAFFDPGSGTPVKVCRARALALAAEKNREERAWEDGEID